jgi:NTP pyrophosphatase (non-canonical NTP hydrolase)
LARTATVITRTFLTPSQELSSSLSLRTEQETDKEKEFLKEQKELALKPRNNQNNFNLMKNFNELSGEIYRWAHDRGLVRKQHVDKQMLKVMEEVGELASGIAKKNRDEIDDAIGDVLVTIIILSAQLNINPIASLNKVYDIISQRTGQTVDGVFIKDESNKD